MLSAELFISVFQDFFQPAHESAVGGNPVTDNGACDKLRTTIRSLLLLVSQYIYLLDCALTFQ